MRRKWLTRLGFVLFAATAAGMGRWATLKMGLQPDGSYLVSSGQRVEGNSVAFDGRPIDLALHPSGNFFAVLNKTAVFLATSSGVIPKTRMFLDGNAGFRGLIWSPDGKVLFASTDQGTIRRFSLESNRLKPLPVIEVVAQGREKKTQPGAWRDGDHPRWVAVVRGAAANRNAVVEIELKTGERVREYPVQNLPFEPRLTADEKTLVVSNWGGRLAKPGERTSKSQEIDILVDARGAASSGTVSLIDRETGATRHVEVGIHPTAIAISGNLPTWPTP